ncbi:transcriptional repressor LexA [Candidatus Poribacteria bacterium]|nr:transcriptional repressor LexA [Candidatus Poribacteria bacterium]
MATLTRRQKEVLDFVRDFVAEKGYSPSLEEIGAGFGMSSVATVHKHLTHLRQKGFIRHEPNRKRSVEVVESHLPEMSPMVDLPLLGTIAAGEPIQAVENKDSIAVPAELAPRRGRRMFVLKVKGDSMVDDHILDGDYVIVVEGRSADNGQTVVALLDNENATLKRYYREKDSVRLQPANESLQPIIVKDRDIRIQGIVVGLMRRY